MESTNKSLVTEFILRGLSEDPQVRIALAFIFLVIYLITLIGNMILLTVCILEPRLHTPMYFFLVNLSILDVCYCSAILPNLIAQLLVRKPISFAGCATQMYIYLLLGGTECVLLAVMAYDRYVAISFPLRYTVIMRKSVYVSLAVICWLTGSLMSIFDTVFTMRLPICGSNVINHFFCEATALLSMVCADTYVAEMVIFTVGIFLLLIPSLIILISYTCIIITIIGMSSASGRRKAFSTSASHLVVVTLMFGTAIYMYMTPVSTNPTGHNKLISVSYTAFQPMMNPVIYSLRNKDVKTAVKKVMGRLRTNETRTIEIH